MIIVLFFFHQHTRRHVSPPFFATRSLRLSRTHGTVGFWPALEATSNHNFYFF